MQVLDSLSYLSTSSVLPVSPSSLCVNNRKSSWTCLTALTSPPPTPCRIFWQCSGKLEIVPEIPAEGIFVLTLMGSLSRTLDQGLSLPVVVETPNYRLAVIVSTVQLAVLQQNFSCKCRIPLLGMSRNDAALAFHQRLTQCERKNFVLAHSVWCIREKLTSKTVLLEL